MTLQRSKLTPDGSDVGKKVKYVPEDIEGVLVSVNGIFARFKFTPRKGKTAYADTDVRNLKLIKKK